MAEADPPPRPRALWATLIAGALLSILVTIRIATRAFVLGSATGGWVYPYLYGFQPRALASWAIVWACCGVLVLVSMSAVRRTQWRIVLVWLALGMLAQGVLRGLTPYSMEELFLGDGSNGFYQPTLRHGPVELLRDFNHVRPTLPEHPQTNMPGKLMFIYALELLSGRPAVLAWLVVAVSNAGGILLYVFVRDLLDDRETALLSLVLYLFVPARFLLFPVLNTVTPVFVFACAWFWLRSLRSRRIGYAAALGACSYAVLFYDPTPAVLGLLFLCLTGHAVWRGDIDWRTVVVLAGGVVAGFALTYLLMRVLFQFDLLTTLRSVAGAATEFNARVKRPYSIWIVENLVDLAFAAGICQAVVFCWSVVQSRGRAAALWIGIAVTIAAADLAGINRGEVVRLWIFFACFAQIPSAYLCARLNSRGALMLVLGATLLQDAVSASMMAFAQP